jgi:hypothetical protein
MPYGPKSKKRAMKSAGKQLKKHSSTAKSGYNKSSMSASKTSRGGTKGYATRTGATKNVKYKGTKKRK